MDRRTFLAATAQPVTGIGPEFALSESDIRASGAKDPIVDMFAHWAMARREWLHLSETHDDWDRPEMLALAESEWDLVREISITNATSLNGLKCQIIVLWEEFGPSITGNNEAQQNDPDLRLKRQTFMGVEALTNVATWQPINPKMLPASLF